MASTPEGKVKDQIKKRLKAARAYWTMPVMTGMATNGTPDFAVCYQGRYLAIEAKAGDGAPTELQWARLMEVERAGGDTMVINESNLDVLDAYLANPSAACVAIREYDSRRVREHAKKF